MRRTNSGTFKNKPDIIDIILETAKLDSGLYNRNEMRYPPMASLVGFMFLDRQNSGGVPEYAIPRFESGFLLEMRYTVLLSISQDKATLLTDKRSKPVASDDHPQVPRTCAARVAGPRR